MLEIIKPETSGDTLRKLTLKEHNLIQVTLIKRSGMKPMDWITANSGKFNLLEANPLRRQLVIDYLERGEEAVLREIERNLYEH